MSLFPHLTRTFSFSFCVYCIPYHIMIFVTVQYSVILKLAKATYNASLENPNSTYYIRIENEVCNVVCINDIFFHLFISFSLLSTSISVPLFGTSKMQNGGQVERIPVCPCDKLLSENNASNVF